MKLDTMIDIETLGTDGTYPTIAQIGAVLFDPLTGRTEDEKVWSINLDNGLPEVDTVLFWLQQPRETIEQVFFAKERFPLQTALNQLKSQFIDKSSCVWARSTNFDLAILTRAFEQTNWEQRTQFIPHWKWRDERVMRDILVRIGRLPERSGTHHNALDDARYQALVVATANQLTASLELARAS